MSKHIKSYMCMCVCVLVIVWDRAPIELVRSKHLEITEPNQLERVLLKQASPMRTPTAEQETSMVFHGFRWFSIDFERRMA